MKIRIGAVQMAVTEDVGENGRRLHAAVEQAAEAGAALLLSPEGSLSGYTPDFDALEVGRALGELTGFAASRGVGLALGTCFREADGLVYNQLRFYAPDGAFLGFHSKILRCGSVDGTQTGEVTRYAVRPLRTFDFLGIRIGGLICNDMWANPMVTPMPDTHLAQRLGRMGARVILHAVNGGRNGTPWSAVNHAFHELNLRMRARAAGIPIVTVDSAEPVNLRTASPSGVVGADGAFVLRAPDAGEAFFDCELAFG